MGPALETRQSHTIENGVIKIVPEGHREGNKSSGCISSGATRSTLFMVHCLGRLCYCGLHAVLWSHIGILISLFAV